MEIKGLKKFIKSLEKRLTKTIEFKNEPWVAVDGIEVNYLGDEKPIISVKVRAGYSFNDNRYQFNKIIELEVDGKDIEYVAGMFANELTHCDAELI